VTAEQVRAWIAGGRANLETKIKVAGSFDWKTVADFPELAAPPAGGGGDAGSPAVGLAVPGATAAAPPLDIVSCYERSWNLLKANFWPVIGVTVLLIAVQVLLYLVRKMIPLFGSVLVNSLVNTALGAGFYYYFLRKVRGQPASINDVFAGFGKAYIPLFLVGLMITAIVLVGFCLLILPGIYLAVSYGFSSLLVLDKGLSPWSAMETSRKTITSAWWRFFALGLLGFVFILVGLACLGVGILVAIPLISGAVVYAYEDLTGPAR
jgi:hypothetical protein